MEWKQGVPEAEGVYLIANPAHFDPIWKYILGEYHIGEYHIGVWDLGDPPRRVRELAKSCWWMLVTEPAKLPECPHCHRILVGA
jgi:hypothetical protein